MSLFDAAAVPFPAGTRRFAVACASALPLRAESVQTVVCSPPYWKARDYGFGPDQLGNEDQVTDFVAHLVAIFDGVRAVLRRDGTLWVNIGDTYNTRSILRTGAHNVGLGHTVERVGASATQTWAEASAAGMVRHSARSGSNLKDKDLPLVPHRFAVAMIDAGWYLRADIVWSKPWCKPERADDRPTRTHESVFMFTRSERYAYYPQRDMDRSVWTIEPASDGGGPAVYPEELPARCIALSTQPGDLVLDPFVGTGTTMRAADRLGRVGVGTDLTAQWLT